MASGITTNKNFISSSIKANAIISLFRKYISILSIKRIVLINHILLSRKSLKKVIMNDIYYSYSIEPTQTNNSNSNTINHSINTNSNSDCQHNSNTEHEKTLINAILSQRSKAVSTLIKWQKQLSYRQLIKSILNKRKTHYVLTSSIREANELILEIYSDEEDKKPKQYLAEYCPLLKESVVYIPKNHEHNLISRMRFKADGKYVIDPKYTTESSAYNEFYNLINFKKMQKEETHEEKENKRVIASVLTSLYREQNEKMMKSVSSFHSLPKSRNGLGKYATKYKSMAVLNTNFKPILKTRPVIRVPSKRKISFGKVDYSY